MGFIDSVLGFGDNHFHFPLNLLFKQIIKTSDNTIIPMNEDDIFKCFDTDDLEFILQDDIINYSYPEQRSFEVLNEDDYHEVVNDYYISSDCNCQVGHVGCCFSGIHILSADSDNPKSTKNAQKQDKETEDLEKKIIAAKTFITKLISQNRFPSDIKLVLRSNCCS